ncbi:SDR family NAD(P)-dependent oxidoreductase [Streptomyces sp. NPDC006879]|uniref:SDR family NAD(P)-dependent oxidoreductase n=1 Tax=Streptomyces sp. NPDC006879 TaxID=3364767 RepID=UPI0036C33D47
MTRRSLAGTRVLVAGATGALGRLATEELGARGARLALAGRDAGRLTELAARAGGRPARQMDAYDTEGCAALAPWAHEQLGGLDGVLVMVGVAGFGRVGEVPETAVEHMFQVNSLCPAAILRPAVTQVSAGGFLAAVTGAIVAAPMLGTADYAAAKTALSCWLGVLAREVRVRGLRVFDFQPPHLDTGFADHPVTGLTPDLPAGADPVAAVQAMVDRLADAGPEHDTPAPRLGRSTGVANRP